MRPKRYLDIELKQTPFEHRAGKMEKPAAARKCHARNIKGVGKAAGGARKLKAPKKDAMRAMERFDALGGSFFFSFSVFFSLFFYFFLFPPLLSRLFTVG